MNTYVYRKHLRSGFGLYAKVLLVMFGFCSIIVFGSILTNQEVMHDSKVYLIAVGILVAIFIFLFMEIGFVYLIFTRRFRYIDVTLTEDAVIYNNKKTQTVIPYDQIEKLEFPSIKYTGGWVKIIYPGGNIRLTVVLENIGDFISEVKVKLMERNMFHVFNEKKLFSFYKTAVFSDESWDRVYKNAKLLLLSYFINIILTIVIIMLSSDNLPHGLLIISCIIAPLIGYILSEIIIGTKINKRVDMESLSLLPRDCAFEQKVIKRSILFTCLAYLLILLLVLFL